MAKPFFWFVESSDLVHPGKYLYGTQSLRFIPVQMTCLLGVAQCTLWLNLFTLWANPCCCGSEIRHGFPASHHWTHPATPHPGAPPPPLPNIYGGSQKAWWTTINNTWLGTLTQHRNSLVPCLFPCMLSVTCFSYNIHHKQLHLRCQANLYLTIVCLPSLNSLPNGNIIWIHVVNCSPKETLAL